VNAEEALERLGSSTQEAIAGVLRNFASDVEAGTVGVVRSGTSPLAGADFPAVATSVSYVDGVSGGNVFLMTRTGARKLAASMMGASVEGIGDDDLSELELSAVGEAVNQMMAAAAAATSSVLGSTVEITPPVTKVLGTLEEANAFVDESPYATAATLTLHGEPCRLVQLVPTAFVLRMTRALEDIEGEEAFELVSELAAPPSTAGGAPVLRHLPVTLSVELGRTRMPVGRAVRLWRGAVVELDQSIDEPLEVLVNGYPFARGRLVLVENEQWAIRIDQVVAEPTARAATEVEVEGGVR
jgi:flagellar motor switch protein FliN/FliY